MERRIVWCVVVLSLVLAACAPSSTQGPTTWLDQPRDGAKLPLEPLEITAHASDEDGVASFEFFVDGTLLIQAPAVGGLLGDATVGWNPSVPGVYTISARAADNQGNTGPEAIALVSVGEVEVSPTPLSPLPTVPAAQPTQETPPQETPSPQPPSSPAPTATQIPPTTEPTPVPPTSTPRPPSPTPTVPPRAPQITYLEASPSTIDEGGCSTVSWGVEYAAEVYLDSGGVGDHDSRQVCPASTTTYALYARSPGGEDTRSVTVTVRPRPTPTPIVTFEVPDFDAPYVSNLNADPTSIRADVFPCAGQQTTVSVFADDPSGVAGVTAYWWLGFQNGESNMNPLGGGWYEAVLGPFDMTGTLQVWFVARDTGGYSNDPPVGPINVEVHTIC